MKTTKIRIQRKITKPQHEQGYKHELERMCCLVLITCNSVWLSTCIYKKQNIPVYDQHYDC